MPPRLAHYALLLTAGTLLFLVNLGGPALWDIDEGRNATAALEMREAGDWIKPTFNGQLRSHKPVLLYWLQMAAYDLFGVNEFAVRLPSALAALVTILFVYELGRALFNPGTGLLAGLVLASSILFCAAAHFANPDALLLAFITGTLFCFWRGHAGAQSGDRAATGWWIAAGIPAGLAVLAKGPMGALLPAAVIGAYLVIAGHWRLLFRPVWLGTVLVCLLVALPWYVWVTVETKRAFLDEFLLTHHLERALNPMEDHSGPPWYYLAIVLAGLVPWSAFLAATTWYGAWSAVRRPWSAFRGMWSLACDAERSDAVDAHRFLWCWIGLYLLAFTIAATKLPNYILPIFPAWAMLIARFLERWRSGSLNVPAWLQPLSVATFLVIGLVTLAGLLIAGGVVDVGLGRSWPGLERWAAVGLVPLAGAAAGAWLLWRGRRTAFVTVSVLTALGFLVPLAGGGSVALNQFRAPRPLVEQAGALQRDQDIRIGCYQLEFLPSLNFYVQRNVQHHPTPQDALESLRQPFQVYLFLPRGDWEQLEPHVRGPHRVLARHREMYRAGEVVVVTNR
jgi:4-amino-4-deoxy-L-arabinose transferase-like glycosyltransferase